MEQKGRSAELQNFSAGIAGDDRGHSGLANRAATVVNECGLLAVKVPNGPVVKHNEGKWEIHTSSV